jgi:hypothetical protein
MMKLLKRVCWMAPRAVDAGRVGALLLAAAALVLGLGAVELVAQEAVTPGPLASSPQMRHFWHVFAAYAIAWGLIFGWAVAILRRIRGVERRFAALQGESPR